MSDAIVERIERALGVEGLAERLADAISASDLQSLLQAVCTLLCCSTSSTARRVSRRSNRALSRSPSSFDSWLVPSYQRCSPCSSASSSGGDYLLPALSASVSAGYLLWLIQAEAREQSARWLTGSVAALVLVPMLMGTL